MARIKSVANMENPEVILEGLVLGVFGFQGSVLGKTPKCISCHRLRWIETCFA